MKEKILTQLGPEAAKRVAAKIESLGYAGAYETAEETARCELGKDASEEAVVERAAIRVQQLLGCIPRKPKASPAPETKADSGKAETPALVLPEVPPKGKGSKKEAQDAGSRDGGTGGASNSGSVNSLGSVS